MNRRVSVANSPLAVTTAIGGIGYRNPVVMRFACCADVNRTGP